VKCDQKPVKDEHATSHTRPPTSWSKPPMVSGQKFFLSYEPIPRYYRSVDRRCWGLAFEEALIGGVRQDSDGEQFFASPPFKPPWHLGASGGRRTSQTVLTIPDPNTHPERRNDITLLTRPAPEERTRPSGPR